MQGKGGVKGDGDRTGTGEVATYICKVWGSSGVKGQGVKGQNSGDIRSQFIHRA